MKKSALNLFLMVSLPVCFLFALSCGEAMETNTKQNSTNAANTAKTPTIVNTATSTNNLANTNVPPDVNTAKDSANMTADSSHIKKNNQNSSNAQPPPTPAATQTPNTANPPENKKEEGIFSFPPPRPTTFREIPAPGGQVSLDEYMSKIKDIFAKAGYGEDRLRYFSHKQEFAMVTHFERIDENGKPFARDRWIEVIPSAGGLGEYFKYLIYGKQSLYRVIAIVVTDESITSKDGQSPDFETAKKWFLTGEYEMSHLTVNSQTTQSFIPGGNFKSYVLIYNFEKHIGEGKPKFMDEFLPAEEQLKNTLIAF